MEGTLTRERLAREIAARQWYHTLELAPQLVTPGWFDLRRIVPRMPLPDSLSGQRCLDIGTFDGFWAFEMERRDADEVVAIDLLDPKRFDWPVGSSPDAVAAIGARKGGHGQFGEGFEIARAALASTVRRVEMSVYDLDAGELGVFEFVYLGSLLLHLRDPVRALECVRSVCAGTLVVCDAVDPTLSMLFRRLPLASLDARGRPWWWKPNHAGLVRMVEAAGFEIVRRPERVAFPPGCWSRPPHSPRPVAFHARWPRGCHPRDHRRSPRHRRRKTQKSGLAGMNRPRLLRAAQMRLRIGGAAALESRLAWILGSPRSGSTWLLGLLNASVRVIAVDEPAIGSHLAIPVSSLVGLHQERLAPEQFRLNDLRRDSADYFFARRYEHIWRPLLRDLILGRLRAQVADSMPGRTANPICVLKEPHGTIGADVLMATLPRSRMILLLRDGRDVVDSELAAATSGSWAMAALAAYAPADDDRLGYLEDRAKVWLARTLVAERAFAAHPEALRMRIRYEDLLEDPEGIIASLSNWLELGLTGDRIREAVTRTDFRRLDPGIRGPWPLCACGQAGVVARDA